MITNRSFLPRAPSFYTDVQIYTVYTHNMLRCLIINSKAFLDGVIALRCDRGKISKSRIFPEEIISGIYVRKLLEGWREYWINKCFNEESAERERVLISPWVVWKEAPSRKTESGGFQLRCAFTMRDKIASKLFSTLNYTSKCIMLSHYMRLSLSSLLTSSQELIQTSFALLITYGALG